MKKIILGALISSAMCSSVFAADAGNGRVNFTGAIIDAPCSIAPESVDQTVDLGQVSNVALADGGKSMPRPFEIALENCDVSSLNDGVSLTFTGAQAEFDESNTILGIVGTGAGAGVQITSGSGEVVQLAKPTAYQTLQNGKNTLLLSAYLIGNGGDISTITPGDFTSVANFTLNYQ